jgi:Nuclease A inhibitor-like protein
MARGRVRRDSFLRMTDTLRATLEGAAKGLLYGSESDRPFEFVRFAGDKRSVAAVTPTEVALLIGAAGARASEMPASKYLEQHTTAFDPEDPRNVELAPRYRALLAVLRTSFLVLRVFRVGEVEIRVLALGNDRETGELAGLSTVAVET